MTQTELRAAFWDGLRLRAISRPDWHMSGFRHVHGNDAYVEFDERLGLGFRPRAVFLLKDNQLRAEILTTSRAGLEMLDRLASAGGRLATIGGSIAEASVSHGRSDGKVQVVWRDAMTCNRSLWPVHHDWIGVTLCELRETMIPLIASARVAP